MIETLKDTDAKNNSFFKEGSTIINEMSDHVRNYICFLLDNNKELSKYAREHFDSAKNKTAATVATKIPEMIKNNKDFLTNFINKQKQDQLPQI